jgi:glucokinase
MRILGVDIGGTKTVVGIVDESGAVLAHKRVETPGALGPDVNLPAMLDACDALARSLGSSFDVIGIGCGGPLDRRTGTLLDIPNLPGWNGICLTKVFEDRFGVRAFLDNDATAAAMGEHAFGAGRGVDDMVFFTMSTGIGGGIIAGGKPYRGSSDYAGEFGHHTIKTDGPVCRCGSRGCLETLASGTAIARIARKKVESGRSSVLKVAREITAEAVFHAAQGGDALSREVWDEAMENMGVGVANVVSILNPSLVIIGGGVTRAGDALFEPVRAIVRKRVMKPIGELVRIVPAANGDLFGLYGAAAVALDGMES